MEIGWTELMVIGVVALIVIGPKDLPEMFRTLGRFTAKARSMAREFSRAMENAARETGVHEVAKDLKSVSSPKSMGLEAVKTAADKFEKLGPAEERGQADIADAGPDSTACPPSDAPRRTGGGDRSVGRSADDPCGSGRGGVCRDGVCWGDGGRVGGGGHGGVVIGHGPRYGGAGREAGQAQGNRGGGGGEAARRVRRARRRSGGGGKAQGGPQAAGQEGRRRRGLR